MVSFKLVKNTDKVLVYHYYPEGDTQKGHGSITINKQNDEVDVNTLAPGDYTYEVSAKEQNLVREAANKKRIESGLEPLTNDQWPVATESFTAIYYADMVVKAVIEALSKGILLQESEIKF